jgi:hypothetical protein
VYDATDCVKFLSVEGAHEDAHPIRNPAEPLGRMALLTDDKKLTTFDIITPGAPTVIKLDETRVPKRGTAVARLRLPPQREAESGAPVLCVSDKWGDVCAFADPMVSTKKRSLLTHTGCIVTALLANKDSSLLISADREERIRVSHFPHCFDIQAFCLGHSRFVSALALVKGKISRGTVPNTPASSSHNHGLRQSVFVHEADAEAIAEVMSPVVPGISHRPGYEPEELLIGGGADSTLRLFHLRTGTLLHTLYFQVGNEISYNPKFLYEPAEKLEETPENLSKFRFAFTGTYGSFGSAGPHADAAMNETAGEEEEPEGKPPKDEGVPDAKRARTGSVGERPESPVEGSAASVASAGEEATIPRAVGAASARRPGPPIFPVNIVEAGNSCMFATFIEGEKAVRLVRVCMDLEPDRIPVALGHATPDLASLPQAQLAQVGVVALNFRPLHISFDPNDTTKLLVGGLVPQSADAHSAFVYQLQAYRIQQMPKGSSEGVGDYNVFRGIHMPEEDHDVTRALNPVLRSLESVPAVDAAKVHASIFADSLDEYDKNVTVAKAHSAATTSAGAGDVKPTAAAITPS